jgi:very-short-patch-repair endonuclease
MVNSKLVSNPQRSIAKMIGGKLNLQEGKYTVDVAMQRNEQLIAIEYDAWYWHGDRQKQDAVRDEALNTLGWRVIRIKSGKHLPQPQQLEEAISELLNGKWYCEIVLDDWGKGPTTTKKRKDGKQK